MGVPEGSKVTVEVEYERGLFGKMKLKTRDKNGPQSRGGVATTGTE